MSRVNNQTLKELKDATELINENITEMRKTIKENLKHSSRTRTKMMK